MNVIRMISILTLAAGLLSAKHPKIAGDLDNADPSSTVDVIVQFTVPPTAKHHQKVKDLGGRLKTDLSGVIKGAHYSVPVNVLAELANDPEVAYISPDRKVRGALDLTAAAVNAAAAANYGLDGTGIGIAIVDSGVTLVNDLKKLGAGSSRIVYNQDFTGLGVTTDAYGHGTHVAGIAAGNGKASADLVGSIRGFIGVAPMANIINLRVLDSNGQGTDSGVIAALQQAIALKSTYNIRVINLSLGRPVYESYTQDPLCQAVESAWEAGIVVAVAAGNQGRNNNGGISGYGTITAPGNDPYVITVGAMKTENTPGRSDDLIASYSSKGPTLFDHTVKPDIVAPGNQVRSLLSSTSATLYTQYPATQVLMSYYATGYTKAVSSAYTELSGTSMATPVVSGAAALLIQQNPSLTPDQVKARLMKTAYKNFPVSSTATDPSTSQLYTSYYDIFTIGAGYLDIQAALASSDIANAPALSPVAVYNAATGTGTLSFAPGSVWGSNLVWGSNVILGGSNILWGTNIVWGDSVVTTGLNVIWGDNTVDAVNIIWGDTSGIIDPAVVLTEGEN
jgi:serine protease AprX